MCFVLKKIWLSQNIIYVDMKGKVDHPKPLGGGARMVCGVIK
ncbi:hypothetical protein [Photobacterium aquimaris]|uniref:Superoxide dismutase [Cu-Zn] n=1 Tax=Photobacterium aquimaris TaxID=512643 RepID=A0A1Y6KX38_9GAMM|nr:hypothetical protein [Photobacterium aquimaris]SMY15936.1 hypothetical protein PAQU9191_01167 [Photobacterium aquimaris]